MAQALYTALCNQASLAVTGTEQRWAMALFAVAQLKSDPYHPYTTRGSGRTGSAGTAFSATPDGVDHWTGRSAAAAAAPGVGNQVWHTLQNDLGHQVTFTINPTSGQSLWSTIFSANKFESGGAWRAGGTSAIIRPADTTSTPAAGRELATTSSVAPSPQSTSNYYNNIVVRQDGKGFYFYSFRDTTPDTNNDHFLTGFFPLTNPQTGDVNPYMALATIGSGMNQGLYGTSGTRSIVGRNFDGTSEDYAGVYMTLQGGTADFSHLDVTDPWLSRKPMQGLFLRGSVNKFVREWVPDIYVGSGNAGDPNFATRNGKTYFKLNNPSSGVALIVPWDGSTTRGTDVLTYKLPSQGVDGAADPIFTDPKKFNAGLEVL